MHPLRGGYAPGVRSITYEQLLQVVARNVRAARLALDISQEEAAHRGGIAARQWQRVESGDPITLRTLLIVATALDVEVSELTHR